MRQLEGGGAVYGKEGREGGWGGRMSRLECGEEGQLSEVDKGKGRAVWGRNATNTPPPCNKLPTSPLRQC